MASNGGSGEADCCKSVEPSKTEKVAESGGEAGKEDEDDKVRMKKELGLLDGTAIILGIIIGSGKKLHKRPSKSAADDFNTFLTLFQVSSFHLRV